MPLTRRPATLDDIPFLLALRRQSMDRHLLASGAGTSDSDHLARLQYRFDCAEVLLRDGEPVGLLKLSRERLDWELIQIQFVVAQQGRGLGTQLLHLVVAEAWRVGASLRLNVLKANPARALYERLGFRVVGETAHEFEMRLMEEAGSAVT
jgi:ribosomal protein S18 acetylase RimI-like enzyme